MLRLAKLGPGREAYYLQTVGIEPPGEWLGQGTKQAGLSGEVGEEELAAFLAGRDPASGEVLGSARHRVRVAGFDLTFAAPNVPRSRYWRPDWLARSMRLPSSVLHKYRS